MCLKQIIINGQNILYIYNADVIKQQKVVTDNAVITTTDYAGAYIYENSSLKFFNHPEGSLHRALLEGVDMSNSIFTNVDFRGVFLLTYNMKLFQNRSKIYRVMKTILFKSLFLALFTLFLCTGQERVIRKLLRKCMYLN